MTNKQILQEALEKAVKNSAGFGIGLMLGKHEVDSRTGWLNGKNQEEPYIKQFSPGGMMEREVAYQVVIFSHEFAKAFWGEEKESILVCPINGCWHTYHNSKHQENRYCPEHGRKLKEQERPIWNQKWKDHLSMMVLEENPIQYLERFLTSQNG